MSSQTTSYLLQKIPPHLTIDRAIRVYRKHFWSYFGLIALIIFPIQALLWGLEYLLTGTAELVAMGTFQRFIGSSPESVSFFILPFGIFAANYIASYGITHQAYQTILGEDVELSIRNGFKIIWQNLGRLLIHLICLFCALLFVVFLNIIPLAGTGIFVLITQLVFPLTIPAILLEPKLKGFQPIKRVWILVRERAKSGTVLIIVLLIILLLINLTLGSVAGARTLTEEAGELDSFDNWIVNLFVIGIAMLWLILQFFIVPIKAIVMAIYYLSLRVDIEGLDISLGTKVWDEDAPKSQLARIQQLPQRNITEEKWISTADIKNGFIVFGIFIGMFMILLVLPLFMSLLFIGAYI